MCSNLNLKSWSLNEISWRLPNSHWATMGFQISKARQFYVVTAGCHPCPGVILACCHSKSTYIVWRTQSYIFCTDWVCELNLTQYCLQTYRNLHSNNFCWDMRFIYDSFVKNCQWNTRNATYFGDIDQVYGFFPHPFFNSQFHTTHFVVLKRSYSVRWKK